MELVAAEAAAPAAETTATTTAPEAATATTPELGVEVARSASVLVATTVAIAATAATAATAVAATATGAEAVSAEAGGRLHFVGLLERGRHGVGRHVEVLTEVLNALVGEAVVEPLPAELLLHVAPGNKGLHKLDDMEVGDLDLAVLMQSLVSR